MYKPKQLYWSQEENKLVSNNSFITYYIQFDGYDFLVFYADGKSKAFTNLNQAKEWVEDVHYPAQILKYFTLDSV